MKLTTLLSMPLSGGLIEWSAVALINIGLVLYCVLSGLYATVESLVVSVDLGAIVVGPFIGFSIYTGAYLVYMNNSGCDRPLWKIRVANVLCQAVHALLFIGLMLLHNEIAINLAFWLCAIVVIVAAGFYWSWVLAKILKKKVSDEYNYYKALETGVKEATIA